MRMACGPIVDCNYALHQELRYIRLLSDCRDQSTACGNDGWDVKLTSAVVAFRGCRRRRLWTGRAVAKMDGGGEGSVAGRSSDGHHHRVPRRPHLGPAGPHDVHHE